MTKGVLIQLPFVQKHLFFGEPIATNSISGARADSLPTSASSAGANTHFCTRQFSSGMALLQHSSHPFYYFLPRPQ